MAAPPRLSVVIPTTHPWPYLKPLLEILLPQCEALQAELLVCDSTGQALPPSYKCVHHLVVPGASVFDLRAKATAAAIGDVIAWTEDHCLPAPDWCAKTLKAHAHHPNADVIGGAVINGSCDDPMDWANFLCTFGPLVPPFDRPPTKRAPAVANLSLKRRAVPPSPIRAGWIESVYLPQALAAATVHFDDHIQVIHIQSWGFWGTFAAHYHNGRSTTGLLADTMPAWRRVRQLLISFAMPGEVTRTSVTPLFGKPVPWLRHLPLVFALAAAFSAGEMVGLLTEDAGRSPLRLE